MRFYVSLPSTEELVVDVLEQANGRTEVRVDGALVPVETSEADGATHVLVGGRVVDLWLEVDGEHVRVATGDGLRLRARVASEPSAPDAGANDPAPATARVRAPMPGRVVKLLVAPGARVEAGAPVIVVEAMKMENELCAETGGVVCAVRAREGQLVDAGATLVEITGDAAAEPRGAP
jgi:biotin carboxyl carrier protein